MLVFGMAFFWFLQGEGSIVGQVFMAFWMLIVVLIISFNVYNLNSNKAAPVAMEEIELDMPDGAGSVEERLRSLERMKKEQLITEAEYQQKRTEIMQQKW
jgi:amino acid permease